MKDNFYKELEHKRAQEAKDKSSSKKDNKNNEKEEPSFSRSAKYKEREEKAKEKESKKEVDTSSNAKNVFSKENLDKSKAFIFGKFSSYKDRISSEINTTKEKLSSMKSNKKTDSLKEEASEEKDKKRNLLPMIIGGIILVPVTGVLFVLIASNFWPENDGMDIAGEESMEETEEVAESEDEGDSQELEDQRFELERELAEGRDEDGSSDETDEESETTEESSDESSDDLASEDLEYEYSESEVDELEEVASAALERSGDQNDSEETTEEEPSTNDEENSSENESTEENADIDVESEEVPEGGTTHTVTSEDNLYQIAIRYYGSGNTENVDRIRDANGISGNDLSVGQTLVIPE